MKKYIYLYVLNEKEKEKSHTNFDLSIITAKDLESAKKLTKKYFINADKDENYYEITDKNEEGIEILSDY